MATIKATLKDIKKNNVIYPQTSADNVYSIDGNTLETKISNIERSLSEVSKSKDYKGYFPNYDALVDPRISPSTGKPYGYPNKIAYPSDRRGWYARVGSSGKDDTTMYYWDVEGNSWVKGSPVEITGITTVNGIQPNDDGNVTVTAEDIPTAFTDEQGNQKSTQEVFNMLQGEHLDLSSSINNLSSNIDDISSNIDGLSSDVGNLSNSINDLEDEISVINDKSTVLYLTNEEMESAVSPSQLLSKYDEGQVVVCNDEGNYKLGSSYKYVAIETEGTPVNAWEEITASGTEITDTLELSKEIVVPETEYSVEYITPSGVSYGFSDIGDGYYKNDNFDVSGYSAAVVKVNINLNRPANISFDYTREAVSTSTTMYFGIVDTEASTSPYDRSGYKYSAGPNTSGTIVYDKTIPEGNHYVYIKFVNYGSKGTGTFKLNVEKENSYSYESTVTLSVGKDNNLLINDENIVTPDDIGMKTYYGDENSPVIVSNIPYGKFIINGRFKLFSDSEGSFIASEGNSSAKFGNVVFTKCVPAVQNANGYVLHIDNCYMNKGSSSLLQDSTTDNYCYYRTDFMTTIYCENGKSSFYAYKSYNKSKELFDFSDPQTESDNPELSDSYKFRYALSTKNTKEYNPTAPYHPATVKFVKDSVELSPTIKAKEDVFSPEPTNELQFATDLTTDSNLYFYKRIGSTTEYEIANKADTKYKNLSLLKTFMQTATFSSTTSMRFELYSADTMLTSGYIYVDWDSTNNRISRVYVNNINLYSYTEGFTTRGDRGDYIDLIEFVLSTIGWTYNENYEMSIDTRITYFGDGIVVPKNVPILRTIEIPLTSGGDGNNIANTYVPNTRTINGKPLSSNVTLTAQDIRTVGHNQETIENALSEFETAIMFMMNKFETDFGDQVTYNLTGTTLTITPKVTQ